MVSVMLSCFLSFAVVGGQYVDVSVQPYAVYNPAESINYEVMEHSSYMLPSFATRHTLLQIAEGSLVDKGVIPVYYLTQFMDGNSIEVSYTEQMTTTTEISFSTSKQQSFSFMSAFSSKVGIDIATLSSTNQVTQTYSIENVTTYTASETSSRTVTYSIKPEVVENEIFAIAQVARVYTVQCDIWQVDDYWWGDYEVTDSRSTFTGYIVVNPYVAVVNQEGEILGG